MDDRDSAETERRPTRKRRFFIGLGILATVICAIVIVALIAVHTPPARRYVADQVVALLAREQIEFSTNQLGYNVLNASVNLRDVRIRSTTWPDAPVFATIGRAQINFSLFQLLRGRFVVQSGTVDDVDVHYFVDEQGRNNLPRPPADPDAPTRKPLDYLVSSLTIAKAHVRYENRQQQIDARLPISSVQVKGNDLTDRHQIEFDAAGGDMRAQDRQAAIDRLAGQVDLGEDDVSIERLEVDTVGSSAAVTGTIAQFDAPVADLTIKSSVDASRVAPLANLKEPVSGAVTIDATAKGPLRAPVVNAHVSGSSLQFRELRDVQLDATAAYDLATRHAALSALDVRGPWGAITGKGDVAVNGSEESRVQATINSVDAGSIMRALRLPYVAATRVNGKLQAAWPGLDYLKARGTADATLRPTASAMSRSAMPLGGRIVARGNGNRIDAQLLQIAVPGGEVNGTVAISGNRQLQGQISGRAADVGQLTSSIEAFMGRPQGSLLPTPIAGGADVTARLGGSLSEPIADTTINAPALEVGTADGIGLNADVSYAPRALTISRADITWEQARAHVDGRVGLGENQPIDLKLSADNLEVGSLLQAANQGDVPVSGMLTARGTVGGTTTRPLAMVTAQGSNLVAYEEQIGSLNADVRLDGREVILDQLVIEKPQPDQPGRLMATGTYRMDDKTYTFDLQSQDLRLVGLLLPDGRRLSGNVQQLAARGAGSVESPDATVDLDIDALEVDASQLGRIVVKGTAKNKEATIAAAAERFNLNADALIALARPWPATLKLRAENLDLAALPLPATTSEKMSRLQGQLRATVEASGNLTEPEAGKASVALESLEGTWNGRPFSVTSPSPVLYANERLTVEKVEVTGRDASLTITGELPLTDEAGIGEIDVDLRGNLATRDAVSAA